MKFSRWGEEKIFIFFYYLKKINTPLHISKSQKNLFMSKISGVEKPISGGEFSPPCPTEKPPHSTFRCLNFFVPLLVFSWFQTTCNCLGRHHVTLTEVISYYLQPLLHRAARKRWWQERRRGVIQAAPALWHGI